jgi:hypothetical protein
VRSIHSIFQRGFAPKITMSPIGIASVFRVLWWNFYTFSMSKHLSIFIFSTSGKWEKTSGKKKIVIFGRNFGNFGNFGNFEIKF